MVDLLVGYCYIIIISLFYTVVIVLVFIPKLEYWHHTFDNVWGVCAVVPYLKNSKK